MSPVEPLQMSGSYDYWLVCLSIIVACLAAYVSLGLLNGILKLHGSAKRNRLAFGAFILGSGIWSMHFIGMLAFKMSMSMRYDIPMTLLSLVVASLAAWMALKIVSRRRTEHIDIVSGSIFMGLGIASMHYIGMEAMRMPARIEYRLDIFIFSIVVAIAVSYAALFLAIHYKNNISANHLKAKVFASVLMGVAISSMHYIGMAAAEFYPEHSITHGIDSALALDSSGIAMSIGVIITILLMAVEMRSARSLRGGFNMKTRFIIATIILVLFSAGSIGAVSYYYMGKYAVEQVAHQQHESEISNEAQVQAIISLLESDARFLSRADPVRAIVGTLAAGESVATKQWQDRLSSVFYEFLKSRENYFQLRLIMQADNGREVVRVNAAGGIVERVMEDALQSKGHRQYFTSGMQMDEGVVGIFGIGLNRENGVISIPYIPVIHAVTPVYGVDGKAVGIIVINMNAQVILDRLVASTLVSASSYITNEKGEFLVHPEPDKAFAFEFGHYESIEQEYPIIESHLRLVMKSGDEEIVTKNAAGADEILHLRRLRLGSFENGPALLVFESFPSGKLMTSASNVGNKIVILTVGLIIVACLFALWLAHLITTPLNKITEATYRFATGENEMNLALPVEDKSEIGILAQSFMGMMHAVRMHDEQIRHNEEFTRSVLDNAAEGIMTVDMSGVILSFNREAESCFGYSGKEIIGRPVDVLISDESDINARKIIEQCIGEEATRRNSFTSEIIGRCKDGAQFPMQLSISRVSTGDEPVCMCIMRDISDRKRAEEELRLAGKIMENTLDGVMVTDNNNLITMVNPAFTTITGYEMEQVIGKNPSILKSGEHDDEFYSMIYKTLDTTGIWQGEILDRKRNGDIHPIWMTLTALKNDAGEINNYMAIFSDISERKVAEEHLEKMAHYDYLTGLPNRLVFHDRLGLALEQAKRNDKQIALLYMDLDRFKEVNDTYGHNTGDLLLKEVARRLRDTLREIDSISRLGGDEFGVIIGSINNMHDAGRVARKIINTLSTSYTIHNHVCDIGVSIGISMFPHDASNISSLEKHADIAMYRAKQRGGNSYQQYDIQMEEEEHRRTVMENALRNATGKGELEIYYQPQISTHIDNIVAIEARLRWNQPGNKILEPVDFLSIAIESGQINAINEWLLMTAISQYSQWRDENPLTNLRLSVQLSSLHMAQKPFPATLKNMLDAASIDAAHLELAISEHDIHSCPERLIPLLHDLSDMGIRMTISEFGSGTSSIADLCKLPVNSVKIDRSCIGDLITNPLNRDLVKAIITASHALDIMVIAEGVMSKPQQQILAELHCDVVQGDLFCPPIAMADLSGRLRHGTFESKKVLVLVPERARK